MMVEVKVSRFENWHVTAPLPLANWFQLRQSTTSNVSALGASVELLEIAHGWVVALLTR